MRGTVLLAPEGINVFVCGLRPMRALSRDILRPHPRLAALSFKESWSDSQSFNRLLVKLKKEIITFRQPHAGRREGRAPAVDAPCSPAGSTAVRDDDGRPVVMVDTRNAFETKVGAFAGAIDPKLSAFTELPAALKRRS